MLSIEISLVVVGDEKLLILNLKAKVDPERVLRSSFDSILACSQSFVF